MEKPAVSVFEPLGRPKSGNKRPQECLKLSDDKLARFLKFFAKTIEKMCDIEQKLAWETKESPY